MSTSAEQLTDGGNKKGVQIANNRKSVFNLQDPVLGAFQSGLEN
jgi:hypothetical protein